VLRQENGEFVASLGYTARSCLKKKGDRIKQNRTKKEQQQKKVEAMWYYINFPSSAMYALTKNNNESYCACYVCNR
jgi:hypothetical protein